MSEFRGVRNINGRPKGAQNASTLSIKQNLQKLVQDNIDTLDADLKALSPKDRVKAITDLVKYVIPSLKQVDAEVNNTNTNLSWLDAWSESDLTKLLNS